jgi:hypothetical protein
MIVKYLEWWIVQCNSCPWNTTLLNGEDERTFHSRETAHDWLNDCLIVDIDSSEEADEWVYFRTGSQYFHHFQTSDTDTCKHCLDREERRRIFEKKYWRWQWLTTHVVDVATVIRENMPPPLCRAPIGFQLYGSELCWALQDAGCHNEHIIAALSDCTDLSREVLRQTILDTILGRIT